MFLTAQAQGPAFVVVEKEDGCSRCCCRAEVEVLKWTVVVVIIGLSLFKASMKASRLRNH